MRSNVLSFLATMVLVTTLSACGGNGSDDIDTYLTEVTGMADRLASATFAWEEAQRTFGPDLRTEGPTRLDALNRLDEASDSVELVAREARIEVRLMQVPPEARAANSIFIDILSDTISGMDLMQRCFRGDGPACFDAEETLTRSDQAKEAWVLEVLKLDR